MNRTKAKDLLPAITHFAKGGDLWWCDIEDPLFLNIWKKQTIFGCNDECKIINIIENKHYEARKAFALGEDIESRYIGKGNWLPELHPTWDLYTEYRPKPKEPVYDYQFTFKRDEQWYMSIDRWQGIKEAMHFIVGSDIAKFEPSKKEKK